MKKLSPFRYPGGKSKQANLILQYMPYDTQEYREAFVGGGGVYFGLDTDRVKKRWINDLNPVLIAVYEAFLHRPKEFIDRCREILPPQSGEEEVSTKGTGKKYNKRLGELFEKFKYNTDMDQALRYFFINRTVWAGRVNFDPEFESRLYYSNPNGWNVTGKKDFLERIGRHVQGTRVTNGDYKDLLEEPGKRVWVYCFPKGSKVRDNVGLERAIETISKGDCLWGGRHVKQTFSHQYNGKLYSIKVQGLPYNPCMTEDHPVLMVKNGRKKELHKQETRTNEQLLKDIQILPVKELEVGDYVCTPIGSNFAEADWGFDSGYVEPSWQTGITKVTNFKQDDLLISELLGYYAAEGHIQSDKKGPKTIVFSFNSKDELHLVDRIKFIIKEVFGLDNVVCYYPKKGGVVQAKLCSHLVGRFISSWVMGQCRKIDIPNKQVNEKLLSFSPQILLAFLKAWLVGDGGCDTGGMIFDSYRNRIKILGTTASKPLSLQIYSMALKCGLSPSYKMRTKKTCFGSTGKVLVPKWDVYFSSVDVDTLEYNYSGRKLSSRRIVGGYLLSKVKEVYSTEYSGTVYNLDVDGDSLVCVDNIASHNCDPPYMVDTKLSPRSKLYELGFTEEDHILFAERCKKCLHRIAISYDDVPEVRELFSDPKFHIYEHSWAYSGTSNDKKEIGKELIITNYPKPLKAADMKDWMENGES